MAVDLNAIKAALAAENEAAKWGPNSPGRDADAREFRRYCAKQLPALVAELEAARATVERLRSQMADIHGNLDIYSRHIVAGTPAQDDGDLAPCLELCRQIAAEAAQGEGEHRDG